MTTTGKTIVDEDGYAITPVSEPKVKLITDDEINRTVNRHLPFTKEDMNCNEKWMLKDKNRMMLKRVLKDLRENPYEIYRFKKDADFQVRHINNDQD